MEPIILQNVSILGKSDWRISKYSLKAGIHQLLMRTGFSYAQE